MAITRSVTTASSTSWNETDVSAVSSSNEFKDVGSYQYAKNYIDSSSGNSAVDVIWHDRLSISGTKTTLDLQALTSKLFSTSITKSLSGLKDLYIENSTTGLGRTANIHMTGIFGLTGLVNGGSGNLTIYPGSHLHYNNFLVGWLVSTGNKEITISDDSGSGVVIDVFLCGTSGIK